MLISFIIPTLDRELDLKKCIDSVHRSSLNAGIEIEIVVVNQSPSRLPEPFSKNQSVVLCNISKIGLSTARNHGIAVSKGEFLVFLDDDAQIKEDFVSELVKLIKGSPGKAYCGRLYDVEKMEYFSKFFAYSPKKYLRYPEFRHFKGSAHIIKRDVFNTVGFYDESFGAGAEFGGAEESDLFFRLKKLGIDVLYSPEIIFYHAIHLTGEKPFTYSRSISAMLVKQIFHDIKHSYLYIWLIAEALYKSSIRIIQYKVSPMRMKEKYNLHQYGLALKGTLAGVADYCNFEKRTHENRN
jgi:GT2 family glycosyltransferase